MTLANATVSSGNATVTTLTAPTHNSASSLTFQTNGTTTAITVDTSQNVGIGTTSPAGKLDVQQSTTDMVGLSILNTNNSVGTTTSSQLRMGITNSAGASYTVIKAQEVANDDWPALTFGVQNAVTTTPTERMRIDSSGNLLVGGTTSSGVLTITSASASSAISIRSGTSELSRTVGQTATAVSTTATAVLPTSLGYGGLAIVNGISGANSFADLVFFGYSTASAISSQTIVGSPVARTYTCVTGQLKLAMASGTYAITAIQQSINAY
jgi:hypothetical protein